MDSKEDEYESLQTKQMRKVKKQLEQALTLKARVDAGEIAPNSEQLEKIKRIRKLQKEYDSFPVVERSVAVVAEEVAPEPTKPSYAAVAAPEPPPAPEVSIPFTHFTTVIRAKCDECQRAAYLDCVSNHRDGKVYCLRCWADFLLMEKVRCSVCKRSMASLRDPATNNNECRKCFRKRMEGRAPHHPHGGAHTVPAAISKQRQQQEPVVSPPPVSSAAVNQPSPLPSKDKPIGHVAITIAAAAGLVLVVTMMMSRVRRS